MWTVTERYTPTCTLTVAVTDSSGMPHRRSAGDDSEEDRHHNLHREHLGLDRPHRHLHLRAGRQRGRLREDRQRPGHGSPGPLFKLVVEPDGRWRALHLGEDPAQSQAEPPVLPASPPVGTEIDLSVRLTWEAADEFIYGSNRIDGNTFSDHLAGGAVEFFICDEPNYEAYAASDTFWAYEIAGEATSGLSPSTFRRTTSITRSFRTRSTWSASQVVQGTAELYYRSMAGIADRLKDRRRA